MEVIDIGFDNLETIDMNNIGSSNNKNVNFGPGIELLMNNNKRSASQNINIELGDLDTLENELNELSGTTKKTVNSSSTSNDSTTKSFTNFASDLFGLGSSSEPQTNNFVNIDNLDTNDSNVGHATAESIGNTKTWDGFGKINEIPLPSESGGGRMNDREKRRKKRLMIKKLEEWYARGLIKTTSNFTMDSNYEEF
jgi:hypothetical protein